ncbi:urease subunit gamma/beta [Blastococcus fimeti]|nr:urease subunit gamma/beta [Blastococcus fimeti]
MKLLPEEEERLQLFLAAELARRRRARGLRLNQPEALALICDEIMEAARDGRSYAEALEIGGTVLGPDDVLDGVPALLDRIQVEALFDEGTVMVTLYHPLGGGDSPVEGPTDDVLINPGRERVTVEVTNTLDRAVQVTSHYHFFEANRGLRFDRAAAFGMRLDVAAGTAVRFEPGDRRPVQLVPMAGNRVVRGIAGLVEGALDDPEVRTRALAAAERAGYLGVTS